MNSSTIDAPSSAHTHIVWQLLATEQTWAPTFARLALGSMIFAHGAQFLLGWFGGFGFALSVKWYVENLHLPVFLVVAKIYLEFFGGLALVLGLGTRLFSLGVTLIMILAIAMVHAANGYFMNWFGNHQGEGFEFHLLAIALGLICVFGGGGNWSLDQVFAGRSGAGPRAAMEASISGARRRGSLSGD